MSFFILGTKQSQRIYNQSVEILQIWNFTKGILIEKALEEILDKKMDHLDLLEIPETIEVQDIPETIEVQEIMIEKIPR